MFIPKEQIVNFNEMLFGTSVKGKLMANPGSFVVTRLGLATMDELQPHPFQNFYDAMQQAMNKNG